MWLRKQPGFIGALMAGAEGVSFRCETNQYENSPKPLPTIKALLDEHVTLTVECLDRLYLNGDIPSLHFSPRNAGYKQNRPHSEQI